VLSCRRGTIEYECDNFDYEEGSDVITTMKKFDVEVDCDLTVSSIFVSCFIDCDLARIAEGVCAQQLHLKKCIWSSPHFNNLSFTLSRLIFSVRTSSATYAEVARSH